MAEKVMFTWSGGKDSAMALYELKSCTNYKISALLTTITEGYNRVSMHGVREILIEEQAKSLGLPLEKVYIGQNASNAEYEAAMKDKLSYYKKAGVSGVAFGDVFLEDLKRYREKNLSKIGLKGIFPIWKKDTRKLAHTFIELGFKAIVTCIDSKALGREFVGRVFDKAFLHSLPCGVDPCGENGEFHTFVYNGPVFSERIQFEKGETVLRDNRYYFCDLIPGVRRKAKT